MKLQRSAALGLNMVWRGGTLGVLLTITGTRPVSFQEPEEKKTASTVSFFPHDFAVSTNSHKDDAMLGQGGVMGVAL